MEAFGESSLESLGWRGEDSQRKRFEVIAAAGDFNGCSLLDVGCGRGDLKRFLDARFKGFTYLGLDHMPAFIEQARQAYAGVPKTMFVECDFTAVTLPAVDYVVASGALGYRSADPAYHFEMIRKMYQCARRALIFNVLDAALFPVHPLLVGRDCDEVVAYCREIAPCVRVITGYLEDDVTLCLHAGHSIM
jgi:SAM-dependent methyltransferase